VVAEDHNNLDRTLKVYLGIRPPQKKLVATSIDILSSETSMSPVKRQLLPPVSSSERKASQNLEEV
jgi:hypothetical protein